MTKKIRVAIVADDLTGAMDTASPFAKRGAATRVVCDRNDLARALSTPCDVLSINTETRHLDEARAAAAVDETVRLIAAASPDVLFKKIDSTLRGNVAVETVAVLNASDKTSAVILPAMPSQGRTVKDGHVFIDGVLLADTPIGRDKLSPPPLENLQTIFGDVACAVPDCETQDTLNRMAEQALAEAGSTLLVGAGGLGASLADLLFGTRKRAPSFHISDGPILFVVGSRTPLAAGQVERLQTSDPDGFRHVEPGASMDGLNSARLIVLKPPMADADATRVAAQMAATAEQIIARCAPAAMLMTGGDTALAVLNRLQRSVVDVLGEVLPGIALSQIMVGDKLLPIVTKAGGFGNGNLFVDVSRFFRT